MKEFRFIKTAFVLALLLSFFGCSSKTHQPPGAHFYAIDTSESAREFYSQFGSALSNQLMELPAETEIRVYRFDSSPAEIYSGRPPSNQEESTHIVKKVKDRKSNTEGTNLLKLLSLINQAAERVQKPYEVTIFTDSGIENMTEDEKSKTAELIELWDKSELFKGIRLLGVRDGWREDIREIIPLSNDKLDIAN